MIKIMSRDKLTEVTVKDVSMTVLVEVKEIMQIKQTSKTSA